MPRDLGQPTVEGTTIVFVIVLIATLLMLSYGGHVIPSFTTAASEPQTVEPPATSPLPQ